MTPLKAIKTHCKWCLGGSLQWVRECGDTNCLLHPLREGKAVKGVSPLKTIRRKCLECCETSQEVRECPGQMHNGFCPIHPYRFGKKPSSLEKEGPQKADFQAESVSEVETEG